MGRRAGSADLPLHGGHVPKWLGDRMTRLGAVISEAIVHRIRPRRVAAPAGTSVLVPVVRRGDGDGLAFLRHHHQRHRRAEARPDAAVRRTRHPCLRRTRQAFAPDAARTGRDRRSRRASTAARSPRQAGWSPRSTAPRSRTASISICTASSSPMTATGSWCSRA